MKLFWKITALCCALVMTVTVINFIAWRPKEEDDEGELVSYLDASVADDDSRITTSYVFNSDSNFFMKGKQLSQTIRIESQTAPPYLHTFSEKNKPDALGGSLLKNSVSFSGYFAPRQVVITAQTALQNANDGSTVRMLEEGEVISVSGKTKDGGWYLDTSGQKFSAADAVRICRRSDFEGGEAHPFAVDIRQKQYIQFEKAGESIYLRFTPDNEYVSLFLENIPAGTSYDLYDSQLNKVGTRVAHNGESTLEIYHCGQKLQSYTLKITGKPTARPICMTFYRDENEWKQNMISATVNHTYSGRFDYYGDEDFFAVSDDITANTDSLALEITGVDSDLLICAYDEDKNLIGRYQRKRGATEQIVLYGLENLYALSVRTVDGRASMSDYTVKFYYIDVRLLGLETYGFKISSKLDWSEKSDGYYSATCKGLTGKKIVEVQAVGKKKVTMTLTTYSGATYSFSEGDEIPLHAGKNTIHITIENDSDKREITLTVTDSDGYDVNTAFVTDSTALLQSAVTSGKQIARLSSGDKILCYGTKQNGFLKAELLDGSGKIGWIDENCVFADYRVCDIPDTYAAKIRALKKAHPNWIFTFVRVGSSLQQAVSAESGQSPIIDTGGGWRRADTSEIEYYMNPLNFLNEQDIFMFEKQVYKEGIYSDAGIGAVWTQRSEALASADYYAECFMEAGRVAGLSPYFIAARASLESGNGTSRLAKGECKGYEGYYNFYGIGAVDSNPTQGAALAKNYNWHSQRIAIVEGASWIKDQYISVLQYTPYFIKYSFVPGRKWHQYMTDITAPRQDAKNCYRAHAAGGTLNTAIEFIIPVFD